MNIIKYILISLFFVPFLMFAEIPVALPGAGITPESSFYFFDKLGETLREFFTFSPKGKARLEVKFAAERISEINIIFEEKGIDAPGIRIAQDRLKIHLANVSEILDEEKAEGNDVDELAEELDDKISASNDSLNDTFKEQKKALKDEKNEIKDKIKVARREDDFDQIEKLDARLDEVKTQLDNLEEKEGDIDEDIEEEKDKIGKALGTKIGAELKIKKAEREMKKVMREVAEEGVDLPPGVFDGVDELLVEAKIAFDAEDFVSAKDLAQQARKNLKTIENMIDEMEDEKEDKEDAEEVIKDAEEEIAKAEEKIAEAREEGKKIFAAEQRLAEAKNKLAVAKVSFDAGNMEEAEELAEDAKDFASEARMKYIGKTIDEIKNNKDKDDKERKNRDDKDDDKEKDNDEGEE